MSEHTDYFVVKADRIETVISKLREAKIPCFIDSADYLDNNQVKHEGWFAVTVYAEMQLSSEGYCFDYKLKEISGMFEKVVSLYESEGAKTWEVEIYLTSNRILSGTFEKHKSTSISESEIIALAQYFSVSAEQLRLKLSYGNMPEFCELVKIPYLHMMSTTGMPDGRGFDYKAKNYAIDVRKL